MVLFVGSRLVLRCHLLHPDGTLLITRLPRRISTRPQNIMKPPSQEPTPVCSRNIQPQYELCLNESSPHYSSNCYVHEDSISRRPQIKKFSREDLISQTPQ